MNLPQPSTGQHPNIEILWVGDVNTGHLNVSIKIGTFFGVSNAFSDTVAREVVDCEELCECDILADSGDLMASFHVEPEHWPDYAHALVRKVFLHVAACPVEWNKRNAMASESYMVGDHLAVSSPRRMN